jgi:hypothetical protein
METKTAFIILIVVIILILALQYYYFNKKNTILQQSIESLQHQILEHQKIISQQDFLLHQIFPSHNINNIHTKPISMTESVAKESFSHPSYQTPQPSYHTPDPSNSFNDSMPFNLTSVLPMVGNLFNVLGSAGAPNLSMHKPSDDIHYIEKSSDSLNIDDELSNELQELNNINDQDIISSNSSSLSSESKSEE